MIFEHEIPSYSHLYFGDSARRKREIEHTASGLLSDKGYEEILTPIFSYHQHRSIDEKSLIRFSDSQNHIVSLRADSTLDVVRIITRRLGRSVEKKKWFYIQPVFRYPSQEQYQIGAEWLNQSDLSGCINDSIDILAALKLSPLLQISNINIPRIVSDLLDLPLEIFKNGNLESLLDKPYPWLRKLIYLQHPVQIDEILDEVPDRIEKELRKIKELCEKVDYPNLVIAPLYYAKMRYYDNLFFRYITGNQTIGMGGNYTYQQIDSSGFALYTDNIIEEMMHS